MTFVRYLHLLAMAFFVGGQLFLVAAVVPSLRDDDDRERLRAIARQFGWGTLAAIGILVGPASHWPRISISGKAAPCTSSSHSLPLLPD